MSLSPEGGETKNIIIGILSEQILMILHQGWEQGGVDKKVDLYGLTNLPLRPRELH